MKSPVPCAHTAGCRPELLCFSHTPFCCSRGPSASAPKSRARLRKCSEACQGKRLARGGGADRQRCRHLAVVGGQTGLFFFSHTILRPVRARSQCSYKLRAYGALEAAALVPARIGEDLMQIRHGPLAQLGGRGEARAASPRRRAETRPRAYRTIERPRMRRRQVACGRGPTPRDGVRGGAGTALLRRRTCRRPRCRPQRVDSAARSQVPGRSGRCSGRHCASRLHVGARVGFAASGEGGNDGGVKCKL